MQTLKQPATMALTPFVASQVAAIHSVSMELGLRFKCRNPIGSESVYLTLRTKGNRTNRTYATIRVSSHAPARLAGNFHISIHPGSSFSSESVRTYFASGFFCDGRSGAETTTLE